MLDMAERWQPGGATVCQWQRRLSVTGSWTETVTGSWTD
jgi:hypothetical protein